MNQSLLTNNRFYVLLSTFLLSIGTYLGIAWIIPTQPLQTIRLEQIYGFMSMIYLYSTLLAGPFCYTFPRFPFVKAYHHARRALGVSTFYFAFLHAFISFFGQLGGFTGLTFLDNTLIASLTIGLIALIIFFILTMLSTDYMINKLTFPTWKRINRLTYLAGILILIHIVIIGTHYTDLATIIPQISFFLLAFLLLLEAPRFDKLLPKRIQPKFGLGHIGTIVLLLILGYNLFPRGETNTPSIFSIHKAHIQLAQQAQQTVTLPSNIPGLDGDRSKRYTVSFNNPQNVEPNQPVDLSFTIYDASTGNPVDWFKPIYSRLMHLIIVNDSLTYFSHTHPSQNQNTFTLTNTFPDNGIYHIYTDFQPLGGIEQQIGFTINVGGASPQEATQKPDREETKTIDTYQITINTYGKLKAKEMSIGQQLITFTIKDARTHKPITNLKPYLSAFGHVTMINEKTYDFIHIHPSNLIPPPPDSSSGPSVDFLPLGIYGPLKPGIYRTFAEFNPNNQLITVDFTVEVQ